ncbi:MAG: RNA polymerase sigma factor [Acidiferrobacterales bacterium]
MDVIPKNVSPAGPPDPAVEADLVAGLRGGDEACYELLVRAYAGQMLAVARRIVRHEEDARDCVQDAFLQVFRNIDKFEARSSLSSWVHRIVVNTALMKVRSQKRHPQDSLEDLMPQFDEDGCRVEIEDRSVSIETLMESKQAREWVRRSIDRLPDNYRNVLIIRDIEGYDTEEAAALLGLTPGAVKVRLHRARAALKSLLTPLMHGEVP